MKLSKNAITTHAGDYQSTVDRNRENPRWRRVVAGVTALAIATTGGIVANRPMDPGVRQESYTSETMDGLPGTGGLGTIAEGEPDITTVTPVVVVPARTVHKVETVSYNNEPADSTPNMPVIQGLPGIMNQLEAQGFEVDEVEAIGESSDYITDPNSLGVPEPEVSNPQKDWSRERAEVASEEITDLLSSTTYNSLLPVSESTDQDVLTAKQLAKFEKIAKSLGYQTAHELASAVLGGRDTRSKSLDTVQKYVLDEMGVTIKVTASKDEPAKVEYIVKTTPGTPDTEIPYYNPYPAATWNPAEEPRYPGRPIDPTDRSDKTAKGRTVAPWRHQKQPGQLNNGGNSGSRGQRSSYRRSMHSVRAGR